MTVAKSIAGGLPLSGVLGKAEIMDAPDDSAVGGTYVGNPVAQAAALAVLDVIEEEQLVERAARDRRHASARGCSRGRSASPRSATSAGSARCSRSSSSTTAATKQPAPELATAVVEAAAARGLLLLKAGLYANCIRVLCPLVITDAELDEALGVVGSRRSRPSLGRLARAAPRQTPVMVGEVIAGRYELEELVGHRRHVERLLGARPLLERNVALKLLHEHYSDDADYVERFRREARAVAQLSHPNIVTVIDRGEDERPPVHRLRVRRGREPEGAARPPRPRCRSAQALELGDPDRRARSRSRTSTGSSTAT